MPVPQFDDLTNDTGMRFYPHYLDVGDLLDIEYYNTSFEDLDLGDLEDVVSKREILQITTDSADKTLPDRDVLLGIVEQAESEFDSHVSVRYNVPIRTNLGFVPREAKNKCKLFFKYYLYSRRPNMPADLARSYDYAIRFLEKVSKGLATIPELVIENGQAKQKVRPTGITGTVARGTDTFGSRRASTIYGKRRPGGFDYPGDEPY